MNCTIHPLVHAHSASQGRKIKSKDLSEAEVLRERGINRNGIKEYAVTYMYTQGIHLYTVRRH